MSEQERRQQQQEEVAVAPNEFPIKSGKKKALIIGISKYDHSNKFPNLDFCENDANEIYNILKDQGYDISSALVGRVEWARMRDEIIKFFRDRRIKPDDTLFFYFSGHGYLDKNTSRTYLATSEIDPEWPESRAIPFDELTTYLNYSNSERITTVLDCCYSGALEVGGGKGAEEEQELAKAEKGEEMASIAEANMRKTVERLIRSGQGKCILASSLEEQRSFGMKDQPYSLFTYFLIQGLKGANGESVDDNGYVTPELLGSYVNKKMYELPTIKQKPIRKIEVTGQIILAYYPHLANRKDYLLHLLKEGKIDEFNKLRKENPQIALNLAGQDLHEKDFTGADLHAVDLTGSYLRESNLTRANLTEAKLIRADLTRANLKQAILTDSNLKEATLEGAILKRTILKGRNLSDMNFCGADLTGANLEGADLQKANLERANLSYANLTRASLSFANLAGANLESAKLVGATLFKANLKGASITAYDPPPVQLYGANLTGAQLQGATVKNVYLGGASLEGADLSDTYFLYTETRNVFIDGVTKTHGIKVIEGEVDSHSAPRVRRALQEIDEKLRKIILRDNPNLARIVEQEQPEH